MARRKNRTSSCDNCGYNFREGENYCPSCGQENHQPNQPIRHLVLEFFESLFHFDTKIFLSLKYLFLKPGQMTREYLDNKRARFVPPMRLYIFVSFIFFLLVGKTLKYGDGAFMKITEPNERDMMQMGSSEDKLLGNKIKSTVLEKDSLIQNIISDSLAARLMEDSVNIVDNFNFWEVSFHFIRNEILTLRGREINNALVDSLLLAKGQKVNFFNRQLLKNFIRGNLGDPDYKKSVENEFIKYTSIFMFALMPVFALILYLMHIRSRRNYYEYLIFSVHMHTALFTFLSCALILRMFTYPYSRLSILLLVAGLMVYFVVSLKSTFEQSFGKVIGKSILIGILYLLTLMICILASLLLGLFMA